MHSNVLEWHNDKSRPRWTRFIHPITHLHTKAKEESIPLKQKTKEWHVARLVPWQEEMTSNMSEGGAHSPQTTRSMEN